MPSEDRTEELPPPIGIIIGPDVDSRALLAVLVRENFRVLLHANTIRIFRIFRIFRIAFPE